MKPIVDGLIEEYSGKVKFYYVDVEKQEFVDLFSAYRVNAVPTFAFINNDGSLNDYFVGGMSKDELKQKIDNLK
ncbi:MAG: thioredoxin family protein [Actinobacteria bacterium]|nr:thioredoxin family protein [Actinomycetota bacterium]